MTEGVATKDDLDRGLAAVKADVVRLEDKMATKEDVAALRAELKADMADLKAELKTDVADLKADLDKGLAAARADLDKGLSDLKAELKADVAELKTDVANLETRLVRFVFAAAAGQVALIVGLLKLIP